MYLLTFIYELVAPLDVTGGCYANNNNNNNSRTARRIQSSLKDPSVP